MAELPEVRKQRSHLALYAVAVIGSAAMGALLSIIALKVTDSRWIANSTLGITIALGIYPVLRERAAEREGSLSFWKYAAAFIVLAFVVNYAVHLTTR